jgi:hypothetical protein
MLIALIAGTLLALLAGHVLPKAMVAAPSPCSFSPPPYCHCSASTVQACPR